MGVILKENNLIYTNKRHEKFLGSSKYRFNAVSNQIYLNEKLRPLIPLSTESEMFTDGFEKERNVHQGSKSIIEQLGRSPLPELEETTEKREKKTEYSLNKKKVREKCSAFFGLRQSRKFLAFFSISFPIGFPDDLCFKCFNTVLTRLRKDCGLKSYLWVAERQNNICDLQPNGTLHFHMLTNNYMYIRKFNYYMAKAIETQIKKHGIVTGGIDYIDKKGNNEVSDEFSVKTYNGVDVRHVNNNKKALNSYLTKYVSKNKIQFYRLPYHSSRDISELFTAETFVSADCSDFAYIKQALEHIQTFVVDNEYCTIEYLCQEQTNGKFFNPPDAWYWLRDYCNEQIYKNHHARVRLKVLPLHQKTRTE